MAYGYEQFKSEGHFYLGLLLIALPIFVAIAEYPDVRYDVTGLQEMRGEVIGIDTTRKRLQGHTLEVALSTSKGVVQLKQDYVGTHYYRAVAPGQHVRAWVGPRSDGGNKAPTYPVWQLENDRRVVMPALDVGDKVLGGYLVLCGGMLIPLLGGLYLVARHLVRRPPSDGMQA